VRGVLLGEEEPDVRRWLASRRTDPARAA
jgi:hypothetical protein